MTSTNEDITDLIGEDSGWTDKREQAKKKNVADEFELDEHAETNE